MVEGDSEWLRLWRSLEENRDYWREKAQRLEIIASNLEEVNRIVAVLKTENDLLKNILHKREMAGTLPVADEREMNEE